MKKRITAFLLLMLITSGTILTACSDTGNNNSETTAETTSVQATETEAAPEYTSPGSDYNGSDFIIASFDYSEGSTVWMASSYCEAYVEEQNGDVINDAIYERNMAVEEDLNVNIGVFSLSNLSNGAAELQKVILAGDHVADIGLVNGSGLPKMFGVSGEYLVDLYELEGIDFTNSWWDQRSIEEFDILGSLFTVSGDISLWGQFAPMVYFFNKAMVEDFSLGNMYDMVRDGAWTIDKLIEMCQTVSGDLNGDGIMDTNDAYGLCHQLSLLRNFVEAFDIRVTEKDSDGISQLVLNNERTVEAVEKVVPLLNDDKITIGTHKFKGYNNVFFDLHLAKFKENTILFNFNQLLCTIDMRDMETDFGIIPSPKLNEEQEEYVSPTSTWWATYLIVPITNGDLLKTGEVTEALGYYSQQIISPAYMDVTVLDKTLRDTDSEEMVNLVLDTIGYDLANYFNWGGITGLISGLSTGNNTNFASMWAANEEKVQAAIDATFDGFLA